MLSTKRKILLVILVAIGLSIFIATTSRKDKIRDNNTDVFSKPFIERHIKVCLKNKNYSLENPTAAEQKECEIIAHKDWDEVRILNNQE